jgi:hypothetical protein
MAHNKADGSAREKALAELFREMRGVEQAITSVEESQVRMANAKNSELAERFPAVAR